MSVYLSRFIPEWHFNSSILTVDAFVEAALRAGSIARAEKCSLVEIEHIEKILAQLLLDF